MPPPHCRGLGRQCGVPGILAGSARGNEPPPPEVPFVALSGAASSISHDSSSRQCDGWLLASNAVQKGGPARNGLERRARPRRIFLQEISPLARFAGSVADARARPPTVGRIIRKASPVPSVGRPRCPGSVICHCPLVSDGGPARTLQNGAPTSRRISCQEISALLGRKTGRIIRKASRSPEVPFLTLSGRGSLARADNVKGGSSRVMLFRKAGPHERLRTPHQRPGGSSCKRFLHSLCSVEMTVGRIIRKASRPPEVPFLTLSDARDVQSAICHGQTMSKVAPRGQCCSERRRAPL